MVDVDPHRLVALERVAAEVRQVLDALPVGVRDAVDALDAPGDVVAVPVVLGWADDDTGPESLRLYATDAGSAPRWARPHARVAETAIRERSRAAEGCRGVVILHAIRGR